ncbi:MAG: NAD(P) transhydrogenase subunit alpha [Proteobacteria bacterium]|nr:NAD(P) transhydrogenase subunit alpha [Pseudomonadota bacterium]
MTPQELAQSATTLSERARTLADDVHALALNSKLLAAQGAAGMHLDPAVLGLTVFVLACFIGYYVVWRVTPALHSPLMAVTNAISSVIIVGALIAAGPAQFDFSKVMGFVAVALASVNIFGGFIVTQRMLQMFKKKKPTGAAS